MNEVSSGESSGPSDGPRSPHQEVFLTPASCITFLRTAVAGALSFAGARGGDFSLLIASLIVYWVGDMADGWCARNFHHETRYGAVLDIICDRFNAAAFYVGLAWIRPELTWPILLYLAEFMTVDTFNSLSFLSWPTISPNYYFEIDRTVWRLNWSKPAKAANSAVFAVLLIWTGWVYVGYAIASVMWIVKIWSMRKIVRRGLPVPRWDQVLADGA